MPARAATGGAKSLDDIMRLALARYPVARGFTPAEFRAAASEVAGADLSGWFATVFDSTAELDYHQALDWFGLRFTAEPSGEDAWLGAETRVDEGRLVVTQVPRGTPAWEAGLGTGDEIAGIGEFRVTPGEWELELANYRLMRVNVTLGREPDRAWNLAIDPASTPVQAAHRSAWTAPSH